VWQFYLRVTINSVISHIARQPIASTEGGRALGTKLLGKHQPLVSFFPRDQLSWGGPSAPPQAGPTRPGCAAAASGYAFAAASLRERAGQLV
jgi:hypothetical protein